MSKFNLVNYQKINGHEPVEKRLREDHSDTAQSVTEKQLDKDRVDEKEVITEKQLEKKRTGKSDKIIEKDLNDSKGGFVKQRNASTYDGDIPKLEEQRLAGDPVEDEKYEAASSTVPKKRWWEKVKSSSGKATVKVAQVSDEMRFDKPHFDKALYNDDEGIVPGGERSALEETSDEGGSNIYSLEDFDISDSEESLSEDVEMFIRKDKQSEQPFPMVYVSIGYDPADFNGDIEMIKQNALEKVLEIRPNLDDKITSADFSEPVETDGEGIIDLRVVGEEYLFDENAGEQNMFTEISYEEADAGGTPMKMGVIKVNVAPDVVEERDILEFIESEHPGLDVTLDNIDMSNLEDGEVSFVIMSKPVAELATQVASTDFPITVSQKKR